MVTIRVLVMAMTATGLVRIGRPVVPVLKASLKNADEDLRWWIQALLDEIGGSDAL